MKKVLLILLFLVISMCSVIPAKHRIPVANATAADWNPASFWYTPWGRSGIHKGIDIFAKKGASVLAATSGIVVYAGFNDIGGNIVLIWGMQWRLYYYAHLQQINVRALQPVSIGEVIGTVGNTGNAQGKPPHLHFVVRSLFPLFWQYDRSQAQAWNKVFYIDPGAFLTSK